MVPALTDCVALAGIALVVCAACLQLPGLTSGSNGRATANGRWLAGICFVVMWIPVGAPQLPVAAYVRGVTSDFSFSLVVMAALGLSAHLFGLKLFDKREHRTVFYAVAPAALFLYPMALGWGDWDAYRLGWGSAGMWAGLLSISVVCWAAGWRLVPLLIGLAMAAWTARLMESTNLWDYLFDPWLATVAIFKSVAAGATQLRGHVLRNKIVGTTRGDIF